MTKRQLYSLITTILAIIIVVFKISPAQELVNQDVSAVVSAPTSTAVIPSQEIASSSTSAYPTNATVVHVADGDTLEARMDGASSTIKVRFLGVNTPETVDPRRAVECFGKEASAFTKQLLQGKRILLKEDPQADNIDKYGRSLRNIFLEDGTDVNALLVKEGYAYAYVSFPQDKRRKAELKRLQEEAKLAKRGLWKLDTCDGMK
ncbi:thermonuclease family protein [Patescibacteria group bacterium]|nr:thermonuclease family protein [Patescibacteria group bacterium]